ncbi:MAG TPA: response regulator [Candidatus Dormibacteraeota bacterium]|nr:response regulator [Candidatus Dormibacteraeota bacterium]
MGQAVALVDDLFFIAKMQETARQVNAELRTVSTGPALLQAAAEDSVKVIIVDLNARSGSLQALEDLKTAGNHKPTIAFLSHVQTALAERARALGCEQVMPRSKFTQDLPKILLMAKS